MTRIFIFIILCIAIALGVIAIVVIASGLCALLETLRQVLRSVVRAVAIMVGATVVSTLLGAMVGLATSFQPRFDPTASGLLAGTLALPVAMTAILFLIRAGSAQEDMPLRTTWTVNPPPPTVQEVRPPSGGGSNSPPSPALDEAPARAGFWSRWSRPGSSTLSNPVADTQLENAWELAQAQADWAASRIARVRTSCLGLLHQTRTDPTNFEVLDWAVFIRKRVPELVGSCLAHCSEATPREREVLLDELVESLERIGAEADLRRSSSRRASKAEFDLHRAHIEERTRRDPSWL